MKYLFFLVILLTSCQPMLYKHVIVEKQEGLYDYKLHSQHPVDVFATWGLPEGLTIVSQEIPFVVNVKGTKKGVKQLIDTWK